MSSKRKPWFPMDYGYTEDKEIVECLLTYGHKAFVLWSVLIDVLYQRGGVIPVKPYVIAELEDRAKLSNHEVVTLINGLVVVGLINYDKANEKISSDRVTKELNLRANFSEEGRKNAAKRWKSGQDPNSDGSPKPTHKTTQKMGGNMAAHIGPQMGTQVTPFMPYNNSKDKGEPKTRLTHTGGSPLEEAPASESGQVNWKGAPSSFDLFESEYPQPLNEEIKGRAWNMWARLHPDERQIAYTSLDKFAEQFEVCPADEYLEGKYWEQIENE